MLNGSEIAVVYAHEQGHQQPERCTTTSSPGFRSVLGIAVLRGYLGLIRLLLPAHICATFMDCVFKAHADACSKLYHLEVDLLDISLLPLL